MRVYDKPIIVKRLSDNGTWQPWRMLHAFVNKTKDSTSSLTFEVRYTSALREIFSYLDEFIIVYRGDVYLIEDYDDFMEQHLTIRLKATILRLGKFFADVTILRKIKTQDDEGFNDQTEKTVETVRCYRESRQGTTLWKNLAAFAEATDLFQIKKPADYELSRAYLLESGGERFEILNIERIKGHDLYLQIIAKCITGAVS